MTEGTIKECGWITAKLPGEELFLGSDANPAWEDDSQGGEAGDCGIVRCSEGKYREGMELDAGCSCPELVGFSQSASTAVVERACIRMRETLQVRVRWT